MYNEIGKKSIPNIYISIPKLVEFLLGIEVNYF